MVVWNLPAEFTAWITALTWPLHGRLAWRLAPLTQGVLFAGPHFAADNGEATCSGNSGTRWGTARGFARVGPSPAGCRTNVG